MGEVKGDFKDKYTTDSKDTTKTLISNDAYALGELIECLINKLSR